MEDSSKRFVSRSVFPVWQLVQISRTFVCTFKSYFHQTLEPSNFFSRVNIQKPVTNLSYFSNHFCPAVWTVTTCLSRIGWQFSVSSFFFHILFWFIMLQELELNFLFQSQFSFSFENLLQIVRVAFISGRILVSKLIYSDSR